MNDFKRRFNLPDSREESEKRFINRAGVLVNGFFKRLQTKPFIGQKSSFNWEIELKKFLNYELGLKTDTDLFSHHMLLNLENCLETLEELGKFFNQNLSEADSNLFSERLKNAVDREPLLNLKWSNGQFLPKGAHELDTVLIEDNLNWLSNPIFESIRSLYSNSLNYLISGATDPAHLKASINEAYQALESTAKIITKREGQDLSGNRELFVQTLPLSKSYKEFYNKIIKEYITFANDYRHGPGSAETMENPELDEAESFVYLTGIFIRLAIKRFDEIKPFTN